MIYAFIQCLELIINIIVIINRKRPALTQIYLDRFLKKNASQEHGSNGRAYLWDPKNNDIKDLSFFVFLARKVSKPIWPVTLSPQFL